MDTALSFVQDYIANEMIFNVSNSPIVLEVLNSSGSKNKQSRSILSVSREEDSLEIREPDEIKINSIDFVEQRQDGSRVKRRVTNETLEQFIDSNRKRHLTHLQTGKERRRASRSQSPSQILLPSNARRVFHIGCDYRLKPKFQQHKYQGH